MLEFLIVFALSYVWHAMGVTIGYHRLISHRSFKCPKFVEHFWVLGGYLAFEGSPLWWATIHRAHHKYSDTPLDPHSPKNGLFNSHTGWMLKDKYPAEFSAERNAKDLISDPIYRFLDQGGSWRKNHSLCLALNLIVRATILVFFGWQAALASLLAGLVVLQIPLALNVLCHIPKLGYKNYNSKDDSVNVWWIGLLAMGEGWHNNHHAAPGSARTGMRPWEFDASWQTIKLMKSLGLVSRVNEMTHEKMMEKQKKEEHTKVKQALLEKYKVAPRRANHKLSPTIAAAIPPVIASLPHVSNLPPLT